jgi:hypothetical protein
MWGIDGLYVVKCNSFRNIQVYDHYNIVYLIIIKHVYSLTMTIQLLRGKINKVEKLMLYNVLI